MKITCPTCAQTLTETVTENSYALLLSCDVCGGEWITTEVALNRVRRTEAPR